MQETQKTDLEEAWEKLVKWRINLSAQVYDQIFNLLEVADEKHMERLRIAYPLEVAVYEEWKRADKIDH